MPDEKLLKYINGGLAQGQSESAVRSMLIENGWVEKDIDNALNFIKQGSLHSARSDSDSDIKPDGTKPNDPV